MLDSTVSGAVDQQIMTARQKRHRPPMQNHCMMRPRRLPPQLRSKEVARSKEVLVLPVSMIWRQEVTVPIQRTPQ